MTEEPTTESPEPQPVITSAIPPTPVCDNPIIHRSKPIILTVVNVIFLIFAFSEIFRCVDRVFDILAAFDLLPFFTSPTSQVPGAGSPALIRNVSLVLSFDFSASVIHAAFAIIFIIIMFRLIDRRPGTPQYAIKGLIVRFFIYHVVQITQRIYSSYTFHKPIDWSNTYFLAGTEFLFYSITILFLMNHSFRAAFIRLPLQQQADKLIDN